MLSQSQLRQQITDQMIAALEQNLLPWRRPWSSTTGGRHSNIFTGRPYSGINPLLLELHAMKHGFSSTSWASFDQWKKLGCTVRARPSHVAAGKWGAQIVFYRSVPKVVVDEETGERDFDEFLVMRSWSVFNADQVDGEAVEQLRSKPLPHNEHLDFAPADDLIEATGAEIQTFGDKAFYRQPIPDGTWPNHEEGDFIVLPPREAFSPAGSFYETAFHELAHWSEVRLGWDHNERGYALGELVAEIAACFVSQELGVPHGEGVANHAAYLKSWIAEMRNDTSFVFVASSQASKVTDFLLSFVKSHAVEPPIAATAQ